MDVDGVNHTTSEPSERRQRGMVEHFWPGIDGEDTFNRGKRDIHAAITPLAVSR